MGYRERVENNEIQITSWLPRSLWLRAKASAALMDLTLEAWLLATIGGAVERQENASTEDRVRAGEKVRAGGPVRKALSSGSDVVDGVVSSPEKKSVSVDAWGVLCGRCRHSKRAHLVPKQDFVKHCTFTGCQCRGFVTPEDPS